MFDEAFNKLSYMSVQYIPHNFIYFAFLIIKALILPPSVFSIIGSVAICSIKKYSTGTATCATLQQSPSSPYATQCIISVTIINIQKMQCMSIYTKLVLYTISLAFAQR